MKTSKLRFLIGIAFFQLTAMGQNVRVTPLPAPTSLEQGLRSHGISDFSAESLTAELKNNNSEVRILAANKLAEDRDLRAVTSIEEALSREQDKDVQIGLAEALFSLNDQEGVAHLQSMCADSAISLQTMTSVVRALRLTRSSGSVCTETFLVLMSQTKDSGELGMAASLLPFIHVDSTPDQARRIVVTLRALLLDKTEQTIVRVSCSNALAKIGTPDSTAAIREAISNEEDPGIKSIFEKDLRTLKGRN